jgi:hypothetical protein
LFLGERKLDYTFLIIWLCVGYIAVYWIWMVIDELLYLYPLV